MTYLPIFWIKQDDWWTKSTWHNRNCYKCFKETRNSEEDHATKDKVAIDEEIKSLYTHVRELTDTVNQLLFKIERLNSDLAIQKTVW